MAPTAAYDEIADWYEHEFLTRSEPGSDPMGINAALRSLLGRGTGATCLEIGCGTGIWAAAIRDLGWTPLGIDVSAAMLRHAARRLAAVQADALRLPIGDATMPAVATIMAHTDMPAYRAVVAEAARVVRPGGVIVHIGVHPCFCGGFADRSDPEAVVVRPGYIDSHWTKDSWTDQGIRDKVGASHMPLSSLLNSFVDAGLTLDRLAEGGEPVPITLAVRAIKVGDPAAS
jgi:SAM-dependent methyltransferase